MTKKTKSLAEHARSNQRSSNAAYTLVDVSNLEPEERKVLVEDAQAGGGTYGLQIVEEAVNGGARAPLFGYYNDGPHAERWASTKKEFGLDAEDVEDGAVAGAQLDVLDPRREAAMREAAAQQAEAEAESIRRGEQNAIREVAGESDDEAAVSRRAGRPTATDHPQNIVDTGLAADAENEVSNAGPSEDNDEEGNPKPSRKSRNPR